MGVDALLELSEDGKVSHFLMVGITNKVVANFQDDILQGIFQIIALLSHRMWYVRETGVDALLKLSKNGKVLNVLIRHY